MESVFYTVRLRLILSFWCMWLGLVVLQPEAFGQSVNGNMTNEKALMLAEKFGIDVGEVDEEIQKILGLTKAEGVVVFAVIGGSPAELSGIKVKAVIKEVDKYEIKTLVDLGNALEQTLPTKNFTVATYEPADPDNQGITGGLNFHFVRILQD
ncbi:MAG: PDZ domain-containing protein [Nitrospirales bacterium]|jgi:membrane-associated protease RseP (regulator of RpoE activity)